MINRFKHKKLTWVDLESPSESELENIILEYAGGSNNWGGIEVKDSAISLENSLIRFNKNAGILLNNATGVFDGLQFNDNVCNIYDYDAGCLPLGD